MYIHNTSLRHRSLCFEASSFFELMNLRKKQKKTEASEEMSGCINYNMNYLISWMICNSKYNY